MSNPGKIPPNDVDDNDEEPIILRPCSTTTCCVRTTSPPTTPLLATKPPEDGVIKVVGDEPVADPRIDQILATMKADHTSHLALFRAKLDALTAVVGKLESAAEGRMVRYRQLQAELSKEEDLAHPASASGAHVDDLNERPSSPQYCPSRIAGQRAPRMEDVVSPPTAPLRRTEVPPSHPPQEAGNASSWLGMFNLFK
jgi:hypothetical protein